MDRRTCLLAVVAALAPRAEAARALRSMSDPLRLGVDVDVFDSGLAAGLIRAFAREAGLAVSPQRAPALAVLPALERGELDMALTNAPEAEQSLVQQGLAHDRLAVASGEFVLVGPKAPAPPRGHGKDAPAPAVAPDDPPLAAGLGLADALAALHARATARPGTLTFLSAANGSGGHQIEQAAWRLARRAPAVAWYHAAAAGATLLSQAERAGAYALVELAVWRANPSPSLQVWVEGDPALRETVHVLSSFRSSHPSAGLFGKWLGSAAGHRVAAAHAGYRAPTGD